MRVIVTTCDHYHHVLKIFIHQFNKHWGQDQPVLIAGFSRPSYELPSNFSFHSIGKIEDYPPHRWADALDRTLSIMDDEVFTLLLDDYILTRPVNISAIRILYDYMVQFKDVVKIDLCEDRLYAQGVDLDYDHAGYIDLIKSMPGSPYHMSLWPGMWNRTHLISILKPGESAQDLEVHGTTRLSHMQDLRVLGTRQAPLRIANVVRSNPQDVNLNRLSEADRYELRTQGVMGES